jgi:hypothetical protein
MYGIVKWYDPFWSAAVMNVYRLVPLTDTHEGQYGWNTAIEGDGFAGGIDFVAKGI